MGMNLKERIVDWYLTRKTGKSKDQREYESWYRQNVNLHTNRIKDMLANFQYIVVVDPEKFFTFDPFTWVVTQDAQQYFWPDCPLDKSAVWIFERVLNGPSTSWEWEISELGGEDRVFVATNNEKDATIITLRWS
jgi:hypothetical protein